MWEFQYNIFYEILLFLRREHIFIDYSRLGEMCLPLESDNYVIINTEGLVFLLIFVSRTFSTHGQPRHMCFL